MAVATLPDSARTTRFDQREIKMATDAVVVTASDIVQIEGMAMTDRSARTNAAWTELSGLGVGRLPH
jgi:hypothetical protein